MSVSVRRVRAIYRKELREYRRNRSLVVGMAILPAIFVVNPLVNVFALPASSAGALRHSNILLYMLGIPAIVPAVIAAYSVAGERQQATLEPMLTTPIPRAEFLLGKALAVLAPSLAIAYAVYAGVLGCVWLFADPAVASALLRGPAMLAQLLFTPLLAGWSIWLGIAVSTRSADARVAQQIGALASLPSIAVTTLMAFDIIHATLPVVLGFAAVLVLGNGVGWRVTAALFDRERLITATT